MRLTTVILLASLLHVSAAGLAQKVSMNATNANLKTIIKELRGQTGYNFILKKKFLDEFKPVSLSVNNADFEEVLKQVFAGQKFSYSIDSKTVIIKEKEKNYIDFLLERLAAINVRGVVRNNTGDLLPGAMVKVKGSPIRTLTNANAEFAINGIEEGRILEISYIGYKTLEVPASRAMFIILEPQVKELDEVAVIRTGYQELTKERATGSYAKPDMEVFKNRTGTTDIVTRLEGLIPGLTIVAGPRVTLKGNGSNQAILRGVGSVELSSDPLYVVNNIATTDISGINPNDVSDITILKDAAAVAIWGARAANGVIIITTKSGGKNQNLQFSYNASFNFKGKPDFGYRPVLSSREYIEAVKETFNATNYPFGSLANSFIAPHEQILYNQANLPTIQVNAKLDSLAGINNIDQINDLFYRDALMSNQTISATSGGEKYSFYGSFSFNDNKSNLPGEKNQVYGLNIRQDINPVKSIRISLNTSLVNGVSRSRPNLNIDNRFLPYQLFQDNSGNAISMPYMSGWSDSVRKNYEQRSRINLVYTPLDEPEYGYSKSNSLSVNLNANIGIDIWKGLSFIGTYSFVKSPGSGVSYQDAKSYQYRRELLGNTVSPTTTSEPVYYLPLTGGKYSTSNTASQNWNIRNQLVYNAAPRSGRDHLSIQVGQETQEQFSSSSSTTFYGYDEALQTFSLPDYAALSRGINSIVQGSFPAYPVTPPSENLQRFVSLFGLASYSFDGKYNVDASWRRDHSNLFGQDKSTQNKPVWSIGGKWLIAKEQFMKNISWLDELSVRATYGIAGNSPFGGGASFNVLSPEYGNNPAGASLVITTPANKKLLWEATRSKNLGLDVAVFKNRIALSLDFYDKNTTDLLGGYVLNPFTGFSTVNGNITGELGGFRNKGLELSLRTINIKSANFSWRSNLIFSYNKNKLTGYIVPNMYNTGAGSRLNADFYSGYSMSTIFAYRYAGLDHTGNPMIRLMDGSTTKISNVAQADDVAYMGTAIPVYNGGFSNTISFRGLSFTANMIYNLGHVMRKDINDVYTGRISGRASWGGGGTSSVFNGNLNSYFKDRWKNPGDEAFTDIPGYISNQYQSYIQRDLNYYLMSDRNVVSASYIKLRDVTFSYALPKSVLDLVRIQSVNVFAQATDFMIWKANKAGIDPEYHNLRAGTRNMRMFKHSYSFGTNITF